MNDYSFDFLHACTSTAKIPRAPVGINLIEKRHGSTIVDNTVGPDECFKEDFLSF